MRTGRWRTWLGVGLLAVLGVSRSAAQQVLPAAPYAPPRPTTLPAQPRPVTVVTDNVLPAAPPATTAPGTLPAHSLPVAEPIDAHGAGHNGHGEAAHGAAHEAGAHGESDPGAFEFWGDYLLLKAHRNAQDYAVLSPDRIQLPGGTIRSVDWETQSGFRVGAGYKMPCEGWMLGTTYTYFHTKNDQQILDAGNGLLFATLTRGGSFDDVTTAAAGSNLDFNVIDIDASKRFSPTHGLDMTVFGGGRFAWIDQKLEAVYNGGAMAAVNSRVSAPVYFYGAGLSAGTEGVWKIMEGRNNTGLGLFARMRGSLVSGEFRNFLTETTNNGAIVIVNVNEKTHAMVPVLELAAGFEMEWEHLNFRVGYEMSNWFNMVNSPDFPDAANIGKVGRRTSDLSLQGLAVRLGVSF